MFTCWIVDPDPFIAMDLVEILKLQIPDCAPTVFNTGTEAMESGAPLPSLAIVHASQKDAAYQSLLERLRDASTPLILLEPTQTSLAGIKAQLVTLPFSSDHIVVALNALFDGPQMRCPQPNLH